MSEEKVRFMFALSAEGTKQLEEGTLVLSSGGLRRKDGSLFEMAKPVFFDLNSFSNNTDRTAEEELQRRLALTTAKMDQTMQGVSDLKDLAWLNYAANCRTYEMTYQGFQRVIGQLDDISTQISRLERKFDNKEINDQFEKAVNFKNNLRTFAGYMKNNNFNATALINIALVLDEIEAYLERLLNELNTGTGNDQIVLKSIEYLLAPYAYVVRRYSALYYYENNEYPSSYEKWVEVVSMITKSEMLKAKLQYYMRVNTNESLENVYIARATALFNLSEVAGQLDFEHLYTLHHSKEEYLSITSQLQNKYEQKDYFKINGHICFEV